LRPYTSGTFDIEPIEIVPFAYVCKFREKHEGDNVPHQAFCLSLLYGTADGKIVIENVKLKLTGGERKVVDEQLKDIAQFKSLSGNKEEPIKEA